MAAALDGVKTESAAQTALAQEVARLTTAIGKEMAQRERLNRELEIAREVQEHLFPQRLPPAPGLDYCGECRPAREVGEDYYDFLELSDARLGIAIGDVSGKGVGAALMMASLEASLRALALVVRDPADLMGRVNSPTVPFSAISVLRVGFENSAGSPIQAGASQSAPSGPLISAQSPLMLPIAG